MLLGAGGAAANGAAMPLFALIFGGLVNSFGGNEDDPDALTEQVTKYSLYFVYLGVGAFVAAYLQVALWTLTGVRQVNRMRGQYLKSVLRQDVGYFDTTATSGRLLQGLNEDCQTIQLAIGDKVGHVIFNLTTAVVGIIIAFTKGWDMTLVMLAVTPFLAGMGFMISVFMARNTSKINTAYADANSIAQQALGNIRTVYAFNGEERTLEAYSASLQPPLKVGIRQGFLGGLVVGITNGVAFFAYALALWYGSTRVVAGAYNGGDVVNVLFSALIGGFALGQAAPNAQYFQQASRQLLGMGRRDCGGVPLGRGAAAHARAGRPAGLAPLRLPTCRPHVKVFREFNLTVPAGKTVALVGESGSGKSTVIGIIERFYDPQAGEVLIDGVDIKKLQLRWLRSQIGLVSQEPTLFATTISENIRLGKPGCTMEEIVEAAKSANAHNFISGLPRGYDTQVGEKGVQMSGGQKQRIAIARAILKDPKILLLDEATSALDAESEHVVQDALDRLMVGRTTVVVAHRLSTVIGADMIAVVKQGHIVEQGSHDELMALGGAYWTLVHTQQQGGGTGDSEEEEEEYEGMGPLTLLAAVPEDDAITPRLSRQSGDAADKSGRAGGFFKKAGTVVPEALAEGLPAPDPSQSAAARGVMPGMALQRGMSGMRRYISFRRKDTKRRREAEQEAVDHRKSTAEEEQIKVPIKRIVALNKPELPAAVTGMLGSAALGMMMPGFAIAFSSILDTFYGPVEDISSGAQKWSLVFVAIGVGAIVAAMFQSYSFNYMGQKLALRVRVLMFRALLRQEVGWYDEDRNSSGVLSSKLSSDALSVKGQFGDTMGLLTQNLVTLIGGLIVAFTNGWKLSLVVVACLPVMACGAYFHTKMQIQSASKEDDTFAQANQTASEALTNIKTIAAFGMEGQVSELYAKKLRVPTLEARRRSNTAGAGFAFGQFSLFATYSLAFWYGGQLVADGESTFKQVMLVFFSIFLAAMGAAQAQLFFPDVAKGKAATQRVFSIIDRVPKIDAASMEGSQPLAVSGEVELRDVTFAYPQRPEVKVFRHFSLHVPQGKTVALVGESGSGKSTVVALIERFYDPLAGQVLLDGRDIRDLNLRWLREQIGLVGQEPVLFNMTVTENIRYGRPDASDEQVEAAARAANAHTFIARLPEKYGTKLGEGGITLSGGQKQRVAIARAIVKDPKVLLLDEATSALDAESEKVVQDALDRLMVGRTTVVVAHRLSTVRDADVIAVVNRGKIIEQGPHEELMARPAGAYSRLVRHQLTRGGASVRLASRRAASFQRLAAAAGAGGDAHQP
ncbi:hypothetical protein CHLNCDRAFT_34209 [Chlorella variabilis]|uniref:Uncharacterized protein n=1 Tax=Chlorella variabilis TaxID=554065 RepID=E1Z685_CHLVA|nr:hypothetical protein CHLNCDRAFT_34209 [Chlorella variabilis]EFN58606.1 hypothetical protein CHLNCDRAFT_34209 [Chlorella variabilis]|eukprot:XP_005850708.1 hypothetical protein CHLNCDRAFT_34209 [Chlorella variabilis]